MPNIVQYCLILSNITKYFQIVINIAQYCPVLFNIVQVTISGHSYQKYDIASNIQILCKIVIVDIFFEIWLCMSPYWDYSPIMPQQESVMKEHWMVAVYVSGNSWFLPEKLLYRLVFGSLWLKLLIFVCFSFNIIKKMDFQVWKMTQFINIKDIWRPPEILTPWRPTSR